MNRILKQLINIKTFRKEKAEREMYFQRKNFIQATEALDKAEKELENYIIESREQEKRLFQRILNKMVKLQTIEDMHYEISLLKEGVLMRKKNKEEAVEQFNTCQQNLKQAQEQYQIALRIEEKFLTLGRLDDEAVLKYTEERNELEIEEVAISAQLKLQQSTQLGI